MQSHEWLDTLHSHPAFAAFQGKVAGYARNLMVEHQGELYCYQNEIRWLNLRDWKRSKKEYRVLLVNEDTRNR
jgi:roadblock/LC7 domain-containing protein